MTIITKRIQVFFVIVSMVLYFFTGCKKESSEDKPVPLVIPATTKIIDQNTWAANISTIDSSESIFTFDKNILLQSNLVSGDIFVSPYGHGYLKKIINIKTEGDKVIIETAFASLADAIQSGSISTSFGLSEQKISKINYLRPGISLVATRQNKIISDRGEISFTIDTYLDEDSTIQIGGEFSINPQINCGLIIDWFSIKKIYVEYEVNESINLNATWTLIDFQYEKEVELASMTFQPILVIVSGFPVILIPELELRAGTNINIHSEIETSFEQQSNYTVGIKYENDQWQSYQSFESSFGFNPPELSANATAKVYIKPQLNIAVYGILSPYLFLEGYSRLDADISMTPWWKLYVGLGVGVGIKAEIFGNVMDYYTDPPLISVEKLIASAPEALPVVQTSPISEITENSARSGGTVIVAGISDILSRGVCWSILENPTTLDAHTSDGAGTGSYTSILQNLDPNTTYFVRAYAENSSGIAYGNQRTFKTNQDINLPVVITANPENVTMTTADLGGDVTSEGTSQVTEKGVCWSQSPLPTTVDSKQICGAGQGQFETTVTGLIASTHYFTRAYAINDHGTAYGSVKEFNTEGFPPPPSDVILPLAVGNYWHYFVDISSQTVTISITGTIIVQGDLCYIWYVEGDQFEWYYRNNPDGCWAYGYNGPSQNPPDLIYKYPATPGDSWQTNWMAVPYQTTMNCESTNTTFESFSNCYKYHFFFPIGKESSLIMPIQIFLEEKLNLQSRNISQGYDIYQYFVPGIGMVGWENYFQGTRLYKVVVTDYHLN